MKKFIHHQNWNYLTGEQIIELFDKEFGGTGCGKSRDGTYVTIQPNMRIVQELKALESATLELLEDRTASTVYRIRQTGVVYQLCQPNGDIFEYDDYEGYQLDDPVDELIKEYDIKEIVHRVYERDGEIYVERVQPPPFEAKYTPGNPLSQLSDIIWKEEEPSMMNQINLLKKAGAFLANYLKNKKRI